MDEKILSVREKQNKTKKTLAVLPAKNHQPLENTEFYLNH